MNSQEKKQFLCGYLEAKGEAERLVEALDYWRGKAEQTTRAIEAAPDGDGRASLQASVAEMDAVRVELGEALSRELAKKKEVERAIDQIEGWKLRELLWLKYISGLTWDAVSKHMQIDGRWVYRLHNRALSKLTIVSQYKKLI